MNVYYFYKIFSLYNDFVYIGSTNNFERRIGEHKSNCYNRNSKKYNYKVYQIIRANGGLNNFRFEKIDCIESDDIDFVKEYEARLMIVYKSNLNSIRPFLTQEDREEIAIKINEKLRCQCGGKYVFRHKALHKKSKKHKRFENNETNEQQTITNIFNITNLTIQN